MAGLLDYYKEHPELWAENEHLVAKDPAYDLGLMDLGVMNLEDRHRGSWSHPNFLTSLFGEEKRYRPRRSGLLGAYNPTPETLHGIPSKEINLFSGPFTEGDNPSYWDDPDIGVEWPIVPQSLSTKDRDAPRLSDVSPQRLPSSGGCEAFPPS